jgi:hypothetical protein
MNFIKNISRLEKSITASFLIPKELKSSSLILAKNNLDDSKTKTFKTPKLINNIFSKNYKSVVVIPYFFLLVKN